MIMEDKKKVLSVENEEKKELTEEEIEKVAGGNYMDEALWLAMEGAKHPPSTPEEFELQKEFPLTWWLRIKKDKK